MDNFFAIFTINNVISFLHGKSTICPSAQVPLFMGVSKKGYSLLAISEMSYIGSWKGVLLITFDNDL